MKRLTVLHIITNLASGGAQMSVAHLCADLQRSGLEVHLAYSSRGGGPLPPYPPLLEVLAEAGVTVWDIPSLRREIHPLSDLKALWDLRRLIGRLKPEVVHTHISKAGILGRLAARLSFVPHILHSVHGWSFYTARGPLLKAAWVWLERLATAKTARLLAVSERQVRDGLAMGIGAPSTYQVVRCGLPLAPYLELGREPMEGRVLRRRHMKEALGLPADAPVLGTVMRLEEAKAPLDWIAVAEAVGKAHPEARFLIVGDGPLEAEVRQALARTSIAPRLLMAGWRTDIAACLSAMDLFLQTSHWEGLPRTLIEAVAVGLPIVATLAGGTAELVLEGENGYVAPPRALEALATRVTELLVDEERREAMAARSRALATTLEAFDQSTVSVQCVALYQSLEAGRGIYRADLQGEVPA